MFGVLGAELGEQRLRGGDVATGGGDFETVVDGGEIGGEGAAAGVAGDADAVGVDFGAGGEIVEGADAVVDHVAGEVIAGEEGLDAEHGVFGGGADELGGAGIGVEELPSFAVADGVPGEGDEAFGGEGAEGDLPSVVGFGSGLVAEGEEDGGGGAGEVVGDVEIGGDEEAGLAFEDHLFDAVFAALEGGDGAGVEGSLGGEAPDVLEDLAADLSGAGLEFGGGIDDRTDGEVAIGVGDEELG